MKRKTLALFVMSVLANSYAQDFKLKGFYYGAEMRRTIDGQPARVVQFTSGKKLDAEQLVRNCVKTFSGKYPNEIIECYAYRSTRIVKLNEVKKATKCWYIMGRGSQNSELTIQRNPILNTAACLPDDR